MNFLGGQLYSTIVGVMGLTGAPVCDWRLILSEEWCQGETSKGTEAQGSRCEPYPTKQSLLFRPDSSLLPWGCLTPSSSLPLTYAKVDRSALIFWCPLALFLPERRVEAGDCSRVSGVSIWPACLLSKSLRSRVRGRLSFSSRYRQDWNFSAVFLYLALWYPPVATVQPAVIEWMESV